MSKTTPMQGEYEQALTFWKALLEASEENRSPMDSTTAALFQFAQSKLEVATIKDTAATEHNGLHYAMWLYITAENMLNHSHNAQLTNLFAQCAFMIALEDSVYEGSFWSYGARLLYEVKLAGIKLSRSLIAAFLAQEGDWNSNRSKGDLLEGNIVAVGIYCAKLKFMACALGDPGVANGEAISQINVPQDFTALDDIFGYYLNEFAIPYLEAKGSKNAKAQVDMFCDYLRKTDFYVAPCSTKYHLCRDGGLAEHTFHVLMNLIWLTLPATVQDLGACVLAAIGHDLCKIGVYHKQYKSKKTYISSDQEAPEGAYIKEDAGGRFYWADDWYYEYKDAMPFGHGRKSAYILHGFFPELDSDVYSAVDAHMADTNAGNYPVNFGVNPLALRLHIADALATYIDEHNM